MLTNISITIQTKIYYDNYKMQNAQTTYIRMRMCMYNAMHLQQHNTKKTKKKNTYTHTHTHIYLLLLFFN